MDATPSERPRFRRLPTPTRSQSRFCLAHAERRADATRARVRFPVNAPRSLCSPFAGIFTDRISSGRDRGIFKGRTSGINARLFSLPLYQPPFISTSFPINSHGLGRRGKANFDFPGHRRAVKNPMVEPPGGKAFHEFPLLSDFAPFIFEPRKF